MIDHLYRNETAYLKRQPAPLWQHRAYDRHAETGGGTPRGGGRRNLGAGSHGAALHGVHGVPIEARVRAAGGRRATGIGKNQSGRCAGGCRSVLLGQYAGNAETAIRPLGIRPYGRELLRSAPALAQGEAVRADEHVHHAMALQHSAASEPRRDKGDEGGVHIQRL